MSVLLGSGIIFAPRCAVASCSPHQLNNCTRWVNRLPVIRAGHLDVVSAIEGQFHHVTGQFRDRGREWKMRCASREASACLSCPVSCEWTRGQMYLPATGIGMQKHSNQITRPLPGRRRSNQYTRSNLPQVHQACPNDSRTRRMRPLSLPSPTGEFPDSCFRANHQRLAV